MNLYKKCAAKAHAFLINNTTLASDNSLRFRHNVLEQNIKINHGNWWQYQCNRDAPETLEFLSGEIDKYDFIKMQKIWSFIGWNNAHIFNILNCYRANINEMWNARKLGGIYITVDLH